MSYNRDRQTGRTTLLVNAVRAAPNAYLVVHSCLMRDLILSDYGLERCIVHSERHRYEHGLTPKAVFIYDHHAQDLEVNRLNMEIDKLKSIIDKVHQQSSLNGNF